jgi:hypothetical protein
VTTTAAAALAAELTLLTCDQPITPEILVAVHDGLSRADSPGIVRIAQRPRLHAVRDLQLPARAR